MPYLPAPPWAKFAERAALFFTYTTIFAGFVQWLTQGSPIIAATGLVFWLSTVAIAACVSAILGVTTGLYRFEWVALPPLMSMLFSIAVIFSYHNASGAALLVVALAASLGRRLIHLTLSANRLRQEGRRDAK